MPACECDELRDKLRNRVEFCRVCGEEALQFCRIAEDARRLMIEAQQRFRKYEMDVDGEAPQDHRDFMQRLAAFLEA